MSHLIRRRYCYCDAAGPNGRTP